MQRLARQLETLEKLQGTNAKVDYITSMFSNTGVNDLPTLVKLLTLDLNPNNVGMNKAKSWICRFYGIFEEEFEMLYESTGDFGETVRIMESKDTHTPLSFNELILFLEKDFSKDEDFAEFKTFFESLSDIGRKWFSKFWIRTPNIGIQTKGIHKAIAKTFKISLTTVELDCAFNDISFVLECYIGGKIVPTNLQHGKFIKPMLAKVKPIRQWPSEVVYDVKYDGNRYQIHKEGESVIIFNRKGKVVTHQFLDIVEQIKSYEADNFILDGEIYPIRSDGSPDEHKKMGTRVHSKTWEKASTVEVKWVIFDCLKWQGASMLNASLRERYDKIIQQEDMALHQIGGDPMAFYNRAISEGFEGIMVKDLNSFYTPAKRDWIKYKPSRVDLDVVIVGAKLGENSNSNLMSSFEIAVKDDNSDTGFQSIGRVGNGFTDEELYSLTNRCKRIVSSYSDNNYKLLPQIIISVDADAVSRNKNGEYGLRFPRKTRFREDKALNEINTITDVINLY
jgi:DNA ligase-1